MTAHALYHRLKARHESIHQDWVNQAKSDPEYGGKNFDANLQRAKIGLRKFGSPKLQKFLEESGLGSHPEMLRLFWILGQSAQKPTAPTREKDLRALFYPNFPNATT